MSIRILLACCAACLTLAGSACDKLSKLPARRTATPAASGQNSAAPAAPRSVPVENSAEARAILREMNENYAGCRFYSDEGRTESFIQVNDEGRSTVSEHRFYIDFVRPAALRVEQDTKLGFGGLKSKTIVWAHGDRTRMLENSSGTGMFAFNEGSDEKDQPWDVIMAGALDASEIPCLLLPDKLPPEDEMPLAGLRGIEGLLVAGEETVDDAPCFKLTGRISNDAIRSHPEVPDFINEDVKIDSTVHLWIEKKRKLLRRVSRTIKIEELFRDETPARAILDIHRIQIDVDRRFTPRINQPAAWHELEFADPATSGDPAAPIPAWLGSEFKPNRKGDAARSEEASKIIFQVLEKHAKCKSYADTGTVELVPILRTDRVLRRYRYRTAFQRPGKLRIDVRIAQAGSDDREYGIWQSKDSIRTTGGDPIAADQWENIAAPINAIEQDADLPLSPALRLLKAAELEGSLFDHAKNLLLLGFQEIDGRRCHVIRGLDQYQYVFTVWIDSKQKTIRRVHAAGPGLGAPRWVTITSKPVLNKKLLKKRLQAPRTERPAESSTAVPATGSLQPDSPTPCESTSVRSVRSPVCRRPLASGRELRRDAVSATSNKHHAGAIARRPESTRTTAQPATGQY